MSFSSQASRDYIIFRANLWQACETYVRQQRELQFPEEEIMQLIVGALVDLCWKLNMFDDPMKFGDFMRTLSRRMARARLAEQREKRQ